jgi:hypothetical protein
MNRRTWSDGVIRQWLKISALGLVLSSVAWFAGEVIGGRLRGHDDALAVALRIAVAALRGGGIGFTLLFAMTLAAGVWYWALRRRT